MANGLTMAPFSVVIGAPALASQLPEVCGLLVEADAKRLQGLQQDCLAAGRSGVVCEPAVLGAGGAEPIQWHRYSDGRLDGPTPPEQWQAFFANVQHLGSEERATVTLADLLSCQGRDALPGELSLSIRQGDPLAILKGTGAWLGQVERVELTAPKAEELWGEATGRWLLEQGFEPAQDQPLHWTRHPLMGRMLELRSERDGLKQRVGELESQLDTIASAIEDMLQSVG